MLGSLVGKNGVIVSKELKFLSNTMSIITTLSNNAAVFECRGLWVSASWGQRRLCVWLWAQSVLQVQPHRLQKGGGMRCMH